MRYCDEFTTHSGKAGVIPPFLYLGVDRDLRACGNSGAGFSHTFAGHLEGDGGGGRVEARGANIAGEALER